MSTYLIADSGATNCQWTLVQNKKRQSVRTIGISPYFLSTESMIEILQKAFAKKIKPEQIEAVYFYGTGLSNPSNVTSLKKALKAVFPKAKLDIQTDLVAAARATCQQQKGIACIIGTGSNTGFYNGKKITKNSPGLGYVLGDEGSGAYLGKKVLQYFLYQTFDEELMLSFQKKYNLNKSDILNKIYREPLPNRYLASFATFLSEHRGHYMIENIAEDCINDFFINHLLQYPQVWKTPVHFSGSVAYYLRDMIKLHCEQYEITCGSITQKPMKGLIDYHLHK